MLSRKTFRALILCTVAWMAAPAGSAEEYQILVLGDFHYDDMKFHDLSENPPKFHYNPVEVKRNLPNSERYQPHMLDIAAEVAADSKFVVQVGDLVQGDCGNEALHHAMLDSAFALLKKYFPNKPVLVTPGNHDYRGPGAKTAYEKFISETMTKESGQTVTSPDYTIRQGKDLFIFLDAGGGGLHLDFLEAELEKNKDARHKFAIGHYPFFPYPGGRGNSVCLFFDKGWEKQRNKLQEIFEKYNVIYICGHVHAHSVIDYQGRQGKISQLMAFSILSPGMLQPSMVLRGKDDFVHKLPRVGEKYQKELELLQPGIREFYFSRNPGGYTVLKISEKKVVADIYLNWMKTPYLSLTLRDEDAPVMALPPPPEPDRAVDLLLKSGHFKVTSSNAETRVRRIDPTTKIAYQEELGQNVSPGAVVRKNNKNQFSFRLPGTPGKRINAAYQAQGDQTPLTAGAYYLLRYRADGCRRAAVNFPVVSLNGEELLNSAEVFNDGREHTMLGRLRKGGEFQNLSVKLGTDTDAMDFELQELLLAKELDTLQKYQFVSERENSAAPGLEPQNLNSKFNADIDEFVSENLRKFHRLTDYRRWENRPEVVMAGIPYRIGENRNLIVPAANPSRIAPVTILGKTLPGIWWRDAAVTVPLRGSAREIYCLLFVSMPTVLSRGAAPAVPMQFHSSDMFMTEVVYQDGSRDWVIPYSLHANGFTIDSFNGSYAIPADETKELDKLILHNFGRSATVALAALTVNRSGARRIPDAVLNPPPHSAAAPEAASASPMRFIKTTNGFEVSGAAGSMRFDCRGELRLSGLKHLLATDAELSVHPNILELELNKKLYTAQDFTVKKVSLTPDRAKINLIGKGELAALALDITLSCEGTDRVIFQARLSNHASQNMEPVLRFPVLNHFRMGKNEDDYIFFPKYRNRLTNQKSFFLTPGNERAYFVQFFDMFNAFHSIGIAYLTCNMNQTVLDYGLFKTEQGIKSFIQYPAQWNRIAAGGALETVPTKIIFHSGDWRRALELYKQWLDTWFRPVRSADMTDFRNCFLLRQEQGTTIWDWQVSCYDPSSGKWRLSELLEQERSRMGLLPDFVHLRGWNQPPLFPGEKPRHGEVLQDYSDGKYAPENYLGQKGDLAREIAMLTSRRIGSSLYTICGFLPKSSEIGRTIGRKITRIDQHGNPVEDSQCYFPCMDLWRDIYAEAIVRAQKATKVKAIYIDIFPYPKNYACYSREHGHSVPSNMSKASHLLAETLRKGLPEECAIWSEDPCMDVDIQYTSGSISYYNVPTSEHRAPEFGISDRAPLLEMPAINVSRFAFPHYRTLTLFSGYDSGLPFSHEFRHFFFNGDGLYDVTDGIFDRRNLDIMRKAQKILHDYRDCFVGAAPRPLIDSAAPGIYVNCFPGRDRTVYTLYNGRFTTFRGTVLKIPHRDGAFYFDAWNDRELPVKIENGMVLLTQELIPQALGCIVQK